MSQATKIIGLVQKLEKQTPVQLHTLRAWDDALVKFERAVDGIADELYRIHRTDFSLFGSQYSRTLIKRLRKLVEE